MVFNERLNSEPVGELGRRHTAARLREQRIDNLAGCYLSQLRILANEVGLPDINDDSKPALAERLLPHYPTIESQTEAVSRSREK